MLSGGSYDRAEWASRVGIARQGCARLRFAYNPMTPFSLPVPRAIDDGGATLTFVEGTSIVFPPIVLGAELACELAWTHWVECQVNAVKKGATTTTEKRLTWAPVRDALQLRWHSSSSAVEQSMTAVSEAERATRAAIEALLSAAGSEPSLETILRDPRGQRTALAEIGAEHQGRRLEIFGICRALMDHITRSRG